MHEVLRSHKHNPTQKFHQNFNNFEIPQILKKIPKSRLECMNMYDESQEKRSYLWKCKQTIKERVGKMKWLSWKC